MKREALDFDDLILVALRLLRQDKGDFDFMAARCLLFLVVCCCSW